MTESPPIEDRQLPEMVPETQRRRIVPLVWLLPAVVVLVALFIVIHARLAQGPTVEIQFQNGEGIDPGKTKIRYKDVEIGEVTEITVAHDRKSVIVKASLRKDASDYLVDDTRFWIVKPRVSGGSVSGLGTLLSGAYIGIDVGSSKNEARRFTGLVAPPAVTSDVPGKQFVLHSDQIGSLSVGSPIFYRHIEAGQVVGYALDAGGASVTVQVFVNAPFDQYVNGATRFWQASGVDMTLGSEGVRVQTESLAAILEGGISFEASPSATPTKVVPANSSFTLYPDREHAMRPPVTEVRPFTMYFKDSLRGLAVGAPVDLRGITIGEVKNLGVEYDRNLGVLRFPVEVAIYPDRVRDRYRVGAAQPALDDRSDSGARTLVDSFVAHGMRAELKTGNLLTGQKYVALDFHPGSPKALIDWSEQPAIFPTVQGSLDEIQDTLNEIATKINRLPLDQTTRQLNATLASMQTALQSTEHLVHQVDSQIAPQVSATLTEATEAMRNAKSVLAEESPMQDDVRKTLLQLSRAAKSVSALADYLERHPESLIRGKLENGQ